MRIVHVMLSKNFSGAERHVVELCTAQARDHEVHVVLHAKGFGDRQNAIAHHFSKSVTIHKVGAPIRQWTFVQVRQILKKLQPDVIHCHLKAASKAVKGVRSSAAKVATLHIDYDPKQHDHMDALIAITPQQLQRVQALSKVPGVHIANWVTGEPATVEQALAIRRAHGIDDDCLLIGTIGRVEESKQHTLLIEAARPLLNSAYWQASAEEMPANLNGLADTTVKLVIVGTGRLYHSIKAENPDVIMPGYSTEAKAWMRAFDVFVSAANYEPFGLVFLEALQAQTPVVATATEGAQHLAGALQISPVPVNDVNALRSAIEVALVTSAKYEKLRHNEARSTANVNMDSTGNDLSTPRPTNAAANLHAFSLEEKSAQVLALYHRFNQQKYER